jgi:Domain of unknown function (DUF222)
MFEHVPPVSEEDVLASPDAVAAELATSLPRADDMSALVMLDPDALSDAGRIDLLVAFERHIALLQATQQQVLASLDGRALDWSGKKVVDYTREQVGAALRLSPGTAERRLAVARTLVDRVPAALELLRAGQTRTASWWTTVARPTGHRPTWQTTSSPATEPARSQDVSVQPGCATWIMPRPGLPEDPPRARTSGRCAPDTTMRSTTPAGASNTDPAASANGEAPPGIATSFTHVPARWAG